MTHIKACFVKFYPEVFFLMIEYLKGSLLSKEPNHIVVMTGGIGFGLEISLATYDALPDNGEECGLFTYSYVREDTLLLFGFATSEERDIFNILINTSGIGPKLSLHILSGMPIEEFATAIAAHDIQKLVTLPGIGKKTAERLCVELKDKLNAFLRLKQETSHVRIPSTGSPLEDAISALVALGVKPTHAEKAVLTASHLLGGDASTEDLIKEGLKHRR